MIEYKYAVMQCNIGLQFVPSQRCPFSPTTPKDLFLIFA